MNKCCVFGIVFLLFFSFGFASAKYSKESIIRIDVPDHDVVYQLQDRFHLSVIDAQDYHVDAYATADMIETLKKAGYRVTILTEDYQSEPGKFPQVIHTYAQVCSTMYALNQTYSSITKLETLGYSASNRLILSMKVTDNPLIEEDEPEFRVVGTHHGNEKISTEISLAFLKYLVENYSFSTQVADLVNNREIWIIPILNPDGHVANSRYNGASVDINRDYGYMWQAGEGSPGPWSQPESRAIQNHSSKNNIIMEYEYHSTQSYVNYLWDYHPADPPDSAYIIQFSQEYADSTYGSNTTRLTKINGYDWYYARGSAQDAIFGVWGGFGTTIETQYPTTQAKVDSICIANRRALMGMLTRAGWGVSGMVRDSISQAPLFAMVRFTSPKRWPVYTDRTVGDFHKMLPAGNYTFTVSANGYTPKTFTVDVPINGTTNVTVDLVPDSMSMYNAQKLIWVRRDRPDMAFRTITMDGLGAPDFSYYSLGPGGTIVLEADPPIRNFPGIDFTVAEGDFSPESYTVSVTNDWRGSWFSYGSSSGTANFDLATVSMDSARYIKIVDAGGSSSSDPNAGFDLDGITYRQNPTSILEQETGNWTLDIGNFSVQPNPARSFINIKYQIPKTKNINEELKIYNIEGRLIQKFSLAGDNQNIFWDLKDESAKLVPAGIYFCVINTGNGVIQQKVVINR